MEQVRVFIAVDIPSALQGRLGAVADRLRQLPGDARWVSAPHLHLTLRFLGEIDLPQVKEVSAAVNRVALRHQAFSVTLAGLGLFPERGVPNVVWVGIGGGQERLSALQRDVERELELEGFPPERHAFSPHLTLARLRGAEAEAWRATACGFGQEPLGSFVVGEVRVMRSELTRRGPIYSVLTAAPLARPAAVGERGE
jgi:2'-5' RNA ligase